MLQIPKRKDAGTAHLQQIGARVVEQACVGPQAVRCVGGAKVLQPAQDVRRRRIKQRQSRVVLQRRGTHGECPLSSPQCNPACSSEKSECTRLNQCRKMQLGTAHLQTRICPERVPELLRQEVQPHDKHAHQRKVHPEGARQDIRYEEGSGTCGVYWCSTASARRPAASRSSRPGLYLSLAYA